jgi:hypothetical protein
MPLAGNCNREACIVDKLNCHVLTLPKYRVSRRDKLLTNERPYEMRQRDTTANDHMASRSVPGEPLRWDKQLAHA